MKSIFKKRNIMVMLVTMASCFGIRAYAQEDGTDPNDMPGAPGPVSFISAIAVDTKRLATDRIHYIPDHGFNLIDKDLNKGCRGSDYVYVGFKTTNDPTQAIMDIIVVTDETGGNLYRGDNHRTIVWRGKTYYPAEYGSDSKGGNLTRGSEYHNQYLYYTKDRSSAGISLSDQPLTSISIAPNPKGPSEEYAKGVFIDDSHSQFLLKSGEMGAGDFYMRFGRHTHIQSSEPNPDGFHTCTVCKAVLDMNTDIPQLDEGGFYGIRNAAQLHWFIDYVNSDPAHCNASARLYENIDLTTSQAEGMKYDPIGSGNNYCVDGANWTGTFDGNGHSISNLKQDVITQDSKTTDVLGFIGVANGCTVTNLKLLNVDLSCTYYGQGYGPYVAGIIGYATGGTITVEDCEVSGTIKALAPNSNEDSYAAGILCNIVSASNDVHIKGCINNADITSSKDASGILCLGNSDFTAEIEECENNGNVTSIESIAYAITYDPDCGYVKNCLNTGKVVINNGDSDDIGVFCYFNDEHCTNNLIFAGCIYVENSADKLLKYRNYMVGNTDVNHISAEDCKSGKACFLLNNETTQDAVWTQHLGTENYPLPHKREYVVSKYTWYENGTTPTDRFTNYKMFADDANSVHRWKESNVTCNADMTTASATLTCKLCNKKITDVTANRVGSKTVFKEMLCDRDGLEEYAFQTNVDGEVFKFYVLKEIPNNNKTSHGNYVFNAELGVKLCEKCGHVANEGFEKPEESDSEYGVGVVSMISKPGHLLWYNRYDQGYGRNVKLLNDLDFSYIMSHRDDCAYVIGSFSGNLFDGNGHTIRGYNNSTSLYYDYDGGFLNIVEGATIKDLTIEGNVNNGASRAAILCNSLNQSTIANCIVRGKISVGMYKDNSIAAGICAGAGNECVIQGCRNYADIHGTGNMVAGIVADCMGHGDRPTRISKCANYGNISGKQFVGGIIGNCNPDDGIVRVADCANYGNIDGENGLGGIVGKQECRDYSEQSALETSYGINTGKITLLAGSNAKGGLCGTVACGIDDGSLEAKQFYYTNVPVAVGTVEKGKLITSNVKWETEEEIASDATCAALNFAGNEFFRAIDPEFDSDDNEESEDEDDEWETEFINKNKAVWALEDVNGKYFPSPFGTKKREIVHLNGEKLYVVEGEVLDKLEILDGFYFNSPTTFSVKDLYYDRNEVKVKKDFYATINLPFAFRDERLKIFAYDHYDSQVGRIYLREVDETMPETPYLVRLADNAGIDEAPLLIEAKNAGIAKSVQQFPKLSSQIPSMATGFYGTYAKQKVVNGNDGFYCFSTKHGDFRKANTTSGTKVGPFRAVFKIKEDNAAAKFAKLSLSEGEDDETTTYIDQSLFVEGDANAPVYNMNGQRIAKSDKRLPGGIYIKGGKKIMVR